MSDHIEQNQDDTAIDHFRRAETAMSPVSSDLDHLQRLATMGTLAAGVAHEINNLLTPVLAYAQLARENPDDREIVEKALSKTIAGIEAAANIAENILGFTTSPDHGTKMATIQSTVDAAAECLGSLPRKRGITIETRIQPGLAITMSPIALQHVLMNLFLNACEAMSQGGRLLVSAEENHDGLACITVSDTGPGIDGEIAGRLFEPFVSMRTDHDAEQAADSGRPGRGLGLTICRYLLANANGSIELVDSAAESGACFRILAPIYRKKRAKAG